VFSEWKGFATSVELRAGMMKIIDLIRDHQATSFVSDNRKLEVVTNEDQLWIRDTWTALAVAAGLKRIAVVVASGGLGRFASEAVLNQIGKTAFATGTFATVSDAIGWAVAEQSKGDSR
jgi:putative Mn2+ efflux pump MntP